MNSKVIITIAVLFAVMFVFGCTQNNNNPAPQTQNNPIIDNNTTNNNATDNNPVSHASTDPVSIGIQNFLFEKTSVTVGVGTVVTWTNADVVVHTVTEDNNAFDSGNIAINGTYSHTFTTPGTYNYHCKKHPSMTATIIVQ